MTERTSKFAELIERDQEQEQSSRQQVDQLLDLITGEAAINEGAMQGYN